MIFGATMKSIDELVHPISFPNREDSLHQLIERIIDKHFSEKCQTQIADVGWDVEERIHRTVDILEEDLFGQV